MSCGVKTDCVSMYYPKYLDPSIHVIVYFTIGARRA